jgi:hypothetical protein
VFVIVSNVAGWDRVLRALGALAMVGGAVFAPLPLEVRVPAFGALAGYLVFSALAGTCFGYRLMGRSTCPLGSQ